MNCEWNKFGLLKLSTTMTQKDILNLTENEKIAKKCWLNLLTRGLKQECDETSNYTMTLPSWYDEKKFKRGQKYFHDNSIGILTAVVYGFIVLLLEPVIVEMFASTKNAITPQAAKKRYTKTIKHMLLWYTDELKPGSDSWKSLVKVRKIHYLVLKLAKDRNGSSLNQRDIVLGSYCFMAFAISRPQMFGISHDNREDREGFVFYWAVICSMLGIKDEYNMCLNSLEVVCLICDISRWQIFIPACQLMTPTYVQMTKSLYEGLNDMLFIFDHETLMFMMKRLLGFPGYQYKVDLSNEAFSRPIFTEQEIKMLQDFYCQHDERYKFVKNFFYENDMQLLKIETNILIGNKTDTASFEIRKILCLSDSDHLNVSTVLNKEWDLQWNDAEFSKLTIKQKVLVNINVFVEQFSCTWLGKLINKVVMKYMMYKLEH